MPILTTLRALAELQAKCSPGPWGADQPITSHGDDDWLVVSPHPTIDTAVNGICEMDWGTKDDAQFIAAARNFPFLALAERLERAEADVRKLRDASIKLAAFICRIPDGALEGHETQELRSEGLRLVQEWKDAERSKS